MFNEISITPSIAKDCLRFHARQAVIIIRAGFINKISHSTGSAKAWLVILLLLGAVTANADHHRGHALEFIESMDFNLDQMEKHLTVFANLYEFTSSEQRNIDVLFRYSGFIKDNLEIAKPILDDPHGDLNAVRARFNQPRGGTRPQSVANLIGGLMHRARMLSRTRQDPRLASVIQRITLAWMDLDKIHWHVQDAFVKKSMATLNFNKWNQRENPALNCLVSIST